GAPSVVAYVLAGLLLGPVFGIMESSPSIDGIAAMGLLLMLFGIAAELRPDSAGHVARTALVASIVQIAFSAAGGLLLCLLLGFATPEAYVIAAALQSRLANLMSSIPDITLIWALAWCFGAAAAATWLNLHPAAGAYVAGLSLAGLRNRDNLRHSLRPVVHSLVVLAILRRAGYSALTAWRASVAVSQAGELSLVLAAVALSAGLIRSSASSLIVAIGLLTICASLSTIRYGDRVHIWLSGDGALGLLGRNHRRIEG
ncbi:MAG: cation:proton antiporter, partial [Longimicrobiales bacterium]